MNGLLAASRREPLRRGPAPLTSPAPRSCAWATMWWSREVRRLLRTGLLLGLSSGLYHGTTLRAHLRQQTNQDPTNRNSGSGDATAGAKREQLLGRIDRAYQLPLLESSRVQGPKSPLRWDMIPASFSDDTCPSPNRILLWSLCRPNVLVPETRWALLELPEPV